MICGFSKWFIYLLQIQSPQPFLSELVTNPCRVGFVQLPLVALLNVTLADTSDSVCCLHQLLVPDTVPVAGDKTGNGSELSKEVCPI